MDYFFTSFWGIFLKVHCRAEKKHVFKGEFYVSKSIALVQVRLYYIGYWSPYQRVKEHRRGKAKEPSPP